MPEDNKATSLPSSSPDSKATDVDLATTGSTAGNNSGKSVLETRGIRGGRYICLDQQGRVPTTGLRLSLIGLPGALLLTAGTVWAIQHIEAQVSRAAPQILNSAGISTDGMAFAVSYRDVAVTGVMPAGVSRQQVQRLLERRTGKFGEDIRNADINALEANIQQPIKQQIKVESAKQRIRLSGSIPDITQNKSLLRLAQDKYGFDNVDYELKAMSAPATTGQSAQLQSLLSILSTMDPQTDSASLRVSNDSIDGTITVTHPTTYAALAQFKTSGLVIHHQLADDGALDVKAATAEGQLVISGTVQTSEQAIVLTKAANAAFEPARVSNELKVRPGETDQNCDAKIVTLQSLIQKFPAFDNAEARLNNNTLEFRGTTSNDEATESAEALVENLSIENVSTQAAIEPSTVNVDAVKPVTYNEADDKAPESQRQMRERQSLQQVFNNFQQTEPGLGVLFEPASSNLDQKARFALDRLLPSIRKHSSANVEIVGHTDDTGSDLHNQNLAIARANSVVDYLASRGVQKQRLRTVGRADSDPTAPNSSSTGRKLNRRVEFFVTGNQPVRTHYEINLPQTGVEVQLITNSDSIFTDSDNKEKQLTTALESANGNDPTLQRVLVKPKVRSSRKPVIDK